MELESNQVISSKIHLQKLMIGKSMRISELGSQFNDSIMQKDHLEHNAQKQTTNNEIKAISDQEDCNFELISSKMFYIPIIILSTLLTASIGLNVYFGIKAFSLSNQVIYRKIEYTWMSGCSDYGYQIILPNLSNKNIQINITHWPECYYQKQFPRTREIQYSPTQQTQNIEQKHPILSVTQQPQTDNLIWIEQQRIQITAFAYNK